MVETVNSGMDEDMSHDPGKAGKASKGSVTRRRLVRAAGLAGPAVITLHSGQAWALSNCAPPGHTSQTGGGQTYGLSGQSSMSQGQLGGPTDPLGGFDNDVAGLTNLSYSC